MTGVCYSPSAVSQPDSSVGTLVFPSPTPRALWPSEVCAWCGMLTEEDCKPMPGCTYVFIKTVTD